MNRLTKVIGCGVVAALSLALGACGDDDDGTDDVSATDETDATVAPTDDGAEEATDDGTDDDTTDDGSEEAADDDEDGSAGDAIDACGALEGVDLEGLLGAPAGEPNDASNAMGGACTVAYESGGSGGVSVAVTTSRSEENYENQQELLGVDEELSGLGDAAFRTGGYLFALDGEKLVRLQVVRNAEVGNTVDPEALRAAMEVMLANLAG